MSLESPSNWILTGRYWVRRSDGFRLPVIQGGASPVTVQVTHRWVADDGDLTGATLLGSGNGEDITRGTGTGNLVRIRIRIEETNGGTFVLTPELKFSYQGGAYEDCGVATDHLRAVTSTQAISDDDVIATARLGAGSGTWEEGHYDENGVAETNIGLKSEHTEMEYCIYVDDATVNDGDTIDLRVYDVDVALTSYTDTPRITVDKVAAPLSVQLNTLVLQTKIEDVIIKSDQIVVLNTLELVSSTPPINIDSGAADLTVTLNTLELSSSVEDVVVSPAEATVALDTLALQTQVEGVVVSPSSTSQTLNNLILSAYVGILDVIPKTYYVDATGGSDSNDGYSTGTAWQTISKVNGETFNPGDRIRFKRGEEWREQLTIETIGSGDANNPITFGAYGSGNNPIFNGSDLVVTWSDEGDNVWSASFVPNGTLTTPRKVFFDGTLGTEEPGGTGNLDGANEWYYNDGTDTLYVYSTGDPDDDYTSPGIEALSEDWGILVNDSDYITVDGIDCTMGNRDCIKSLGTSQYTTIKNLTVSHGGYTGLQVSQSASGSYIYNVTAHDNGIDLLGHGFYMTAPTGTIDFLIERCTAYDNPGSGFALWQGNGGTVKYCISHDNRAGFDISDPADDANFNIYYCMAWYHHADVGRSLRAAHCGLTGNGNNTVNIYNVVSFAERYHAFYFDDNHATDTKINIKNCIIKDSTVSVVYITATGGVLTLDHNCYEHVADEGMIYWYDIESYTMAQFATYQSERSQDANSYAADPKFVNAAGDNFHLLSDSPCRNVGVDVGLTQDYDGVSVPQETDPAIGAYEYILVPEVLIFAKRPVGRRYAYQPKIIGGEAPTDVAPPSPQTVTLNTLVLTSNIGDITISAGAVSQSLNTLELLTTIENIAVSPAEATMALDTLILQTQIENAVISPSAISQLLNTIELYSFTSDIAVSAGVVSIQTDTLVLTSYIDSSTVIAGTASILLDELVLNSQIIPLTVSSSAVSQLLDSLILRSSAGDVSISIGAVSVLLDTLKLISSVPSATISPAAVSQLLDTLILSSSIEDIGISPSAVSQILDTLLLTSYIDDLSIPIAIILETLILNISVEDLVVSPSAASQVLDTLILLSSVEDIDIALGAASILLNELILNASVEDISVLPGAVSNVLDTLILNSQIEDVVISPAAVSTSLDTLELSSFAETLSLAIGATYTLLDSLQIESEIPNLSVVPSAVSLQLDELILTSQIPDLTVAGVAALTVLLNEIILTSNIDAITVSAEAVSIALDELILNADAGNIDILIGAVSILLDSLQITSEIGDISVLPGAVSIQLDTLVLEAIANALGVSPGVASTLLDTLELHSSAEQLNIIFGAAYVLLQSLSAQFNIPDIEIVPEAVSTALDTLELTSYIDDIFVVTTTPTIYLDTLALQSQAVSLAIAPAAVSLSLDTLILNGQAVDLIAKIVQAYVAGGVAISDKLISDILLFEDLISDLSLSDEAIGNVIITDGDHG